MPMHYTSLSCGENL